MASKSVSINPQCDPVPPNRDAQPGETVTFKSNHSDATLDFDRDPFKEQGNPYTISKGESLDLTVLDDASGDYPYGVTECDGTKGSKRSARPRMIIQE